MPTYRNDTANTYHVYDIEGHLQQVAPNESIETYEILGTGWTKTADTPVKVTASRVFLVGATTGDWQTITLPAGLVASSVLIQVHNGIATDFVSYGTNPSGFHYSTTGEDDYAFIQCVGSLSLDVKNTDSLYVGCVRAAVDQYISVMVV